MKIIILVSLLSFVLLTQGSPTQNDLNISNETNIGIIGGSAAPEGAYPYHVSLSQVNAEIHNCGGSILNNRWILTAAHCIDQGPPAVVIMGTNRVDSGGVRYRVEQVIIHEGYVIGSTGGEHDIGLVRVSTDIAFSGTVQPISLPSRETGGGASVTAMGFGRIQTDGILLNILLYVNLRTITNEECSKIKQKPIPATQICTPANGQGICQGDSGGPLVEGSQVVGIVSWSSLPCGTRADGYTRVYSYVNWIRTKMY